MSFYLSSLLYTRTFNSRSCSEKNFISYYAFNAKLKDSKNQTLNYRNDYGENSELILELYIHSYQDIPFLRDGRSILLAHFE